MSLVFSTRARGLFAILVVIACTASAQQRQKPNRPELLRPTEPSSTGLNFAEPNATPASKTNAAADATSKDATEPPVKRFFGMSEKASRKPYEFFSPENSFEAPPVQRPPSGGNDKRAREMRDRRKNWVFTTPEELYGLQTTEEMMGMQEFGRDGEVKAQKTAMERYYERNDSSAPSRTPKRNSPENWMRSDDRDEKSSRATEVKDDTSFFSRRSDSSDRTSVLFGSDQKQLDSGFSDFFNSGVTADSSLPKDKETAARDARMQQFKQLFSPQPTPSSSGNPWATTPSSSANSFSAGAGAPRPSAAALPSALPSPAAASSPFPTYTPPPVAPARTVGPSAPVFELPKRKF